MALDLEEVSRKFYEILNIHTLEYIQDWLKNNEKQDSAEKEIKQMKKQTVQTITRR